jgi:hypothetical protein
MRNGSSNVRVTLDPVMLEFGATVYICQIFENSLCLLLALISEHRLPSDGQSFGASWDFHSGKTLGQLVSALGQQLDLPPDLEAFLREGIKKRNAVIHGFMTRKALPLVEPNGRLEIIDELRTLRKDIRARDLLIVKLADTLLKKYNLSTDILKKRADYFWDGLNPDASATKH